MNMTQESEKSFIVIPSFNEETVIRELVEKIQNQGNWRIVIVDDASENPVENALKGLNNIVTLRHKANCGAGAASQTGIKYALKNGAEHIVLMDADGQHQPEQIKDLLAPVISGEADIVIGSRFIGDTRQSNIPLIKKLALKFAIFFKF